VTGIFRKELRENVRWAVVIAGVLGVLTYFFMMEGDLYLLMRLAARCTTFVAPLAGLLLGVAQTLFETLPDNWAFVVHRPVSRRAVFAAKCAAGLVLLYGALALPCLLAAAWAARPGNLAMPFQARMVLPMLADVLLAGCFYFAGMVLTLRQARWSGSRLLPLGLAIACHQAVTRFVPEFSQAVALILAVQGVAAVAAWGVFASAGAADRGGAPRFALAVMTYPGALAVGLAFAALPNLFYATSRWQQYELDRDGNLVRITWARRINSERTATVTDAAGQPLPQYDGIDLGDPAHADRFVRFTTTLGDDRLAPGLFRTLYLGGGYRSPTPGVIRLRAAAPPGVRLRTVCLFNVPRRVIELYDPVTRLPLGTVGPAGFALAPAPPGEVFPDAPLNPWQQGETHTLAFPSAVYWMELDRRRVRPVFTAAADDPVVSAVELSSPSDPKVLVVTRSRLHLLRRSGEALFSVPLVWNPGKRYFRPAVLPSNGHLVLFAGNRSDDDGEAPRPEYGEFAADGRIVRRTELPQAPDLGGVKVPQTALFGLVYPLAARPLVPAWVVDAVLDLRTRPYAGLFHGFMIGSAVLCAAATVPLGRRYGFGTAKTAAWSAANLLFGPGSLIVMLSLNEWPAREPCTACGGRRLVGRRACSRCGAPLPPPACEGREIFEPADAFPAVA
jgi:hypothetical protein